MSCKISQLRSSTLPITGHVRCHDSTIRGESFFQIHEALFSKAFRWLWISLGVTFDLRYRVNRVQPLRDLSVHVVPLPVLNFFNLSIIRTHFLDELVHRFHHGSVSEQIALSTTSRASVPLSTIAFKKSRRVCSYLTAAARFGDNERRDEMHATGTIDRYTRIRNFEKFFRDYFYFCRDEGMRFGG